MGARGPIGKSAALRRLQGNPGKRPLPSDAAEYFPPDTKAEAPAGDVPEPPEPLRGEARGEWDRVAPELHRRGWLRPVETRMLSLYCLAWAEWQRAAEVLDRALDDPTAKPGDVRLWQGIVRGAEARTLRIAREFGMTPASRARMPEATPEPRAPHAAERFFT